MTPAELNDQDLLTFGGFKTAEELSPAPEVPARDDMDLCFVCMRWASGDDACRHAVRCEYQLALDRLEYY